MLRAVIDLPRWLFLAALVFAPWAYGCTPKWTIGIFVILTNAILVLWLAGCALRRKKPLIPPLMLGCVVLLLIQGWLMAFNPRYRDAGDFLLTPVVPWLNWAPSTVDKATSVATMMRLTALLGIACFVSDTAARGEWRHRICWTVGLTGVSLTVFGLFQSASAGPILFWGEAEATIPYFASYYYPGNAGAFINLVLPLIAGLAALTLGKPELHLARAIWLPGFFVCAAGAFINFSRAATAISVLLCVILVVWQFRGAPTEQFLPPRKLRLLYAALMAMILICFVAFSGWERPAQKWSILASQLNTANTRLVAAQVCLRIIPDADWCGFGPGTFQLVFPHYTGAQGAVIPGVWRYAHDDYLQTLIEWGWLGAVPWAVLFFGAMAKLFMHWRKMRGLGTPDRVLLFTSGLALAGVALHAIIDFPLQIASLQLYAATYAGFGWGSNTWTRN